jgi:hypothetical protein
MPLEKLFIEGQFLDDDVSSGFQIHFNDFVYQHVGIALRQDIKDLGRV